MKGYFLSIYFIFLFLSSFSLFSQAPANDDKVNALELTLDSIGGFLSSGAPYSNYNATVDGVRPTNWQVGPNKNIWFKFKPGPSGIGNITVRRGTIKGAMLALYDSSMNEVGSKGKEPNLWTNNGLVVEGLDTAQYYYLTIDSYQGGTFDLFIRGSIDNDYKEGALELTLDANGDFYSSGAPYSNYSATADGDRPSNWQSGPSKNIWFKFKPGSSGIANITVRRGGLQGAMLALYDSSMNEVGSKGSDPNYWTNNGLVLKELDSAQYYYLSVDSYVYSSYQGGTFDLYIQGSIDNDYKEGALELTLDANGDFYSSGAPYNNYNATADGDRPSNWQSGPSKNIWFKFKPGPSGIANITVRRGGLQGAMLALYDSSMNEVGSKGSDPNYWTNNGLVLKELDSAQYYYLSVDSYVYSSYQGGTFDLYIQGSIDNDYKEGALELTLDANGDFYSSGAPYNNYNATADGDRPSNWQQGPNKNVWFKFKPGTSGIANITVKRGGVYGAMLALYDSNMNEVGSKGNESNLWNNNGLVVEGLDSTQYYYLSVDSYVYSSYQGGTFDLYIQGSIDNDYKEGALELTLDANGDFYSSGAPYNNYSATADGDRPSNWQEGPNKNIWFKVWIPEDGSMDFEINRGSIKRIMYALYDSQDSLIASDGYIGNFDSRNFNVQSLKGNQFYYLTVDSYLYSGWFGGSFGISVSFQKQVNCTNELWAISSGAWDDPNTWSDTEGGQPVSAIPCEETVVYIKGFDVSFNTTETVVAKRLELIGTSSSVMTRLNVQTGELNVVEKIVTSGAGAKLQSSTSSTIKVIGAGGG
ncbi:hypothetical protein [Roseivirga seohaensis]|uniref:hypothetical protein n=1 Tax=Roseivirga seohaensis TaxID=1914963 RepID=UPI003BAD61FF